MATAKGAEVLEAIIDQVSTDLGGRILLKSDQKKAIVDLLRKKDVLAVLPTRFGKSLIFQYFVLAKSKHKISQTSQTNASASALIICPLLSIVEDQIKEAGEFGKTACQLKTILEEQILDPRKLIFASAEDIVSPVFRNLKNTTILNDGIELLVVDESHTVKTWTCTRNKSGKRRRKNDVRPFCEAFGELSVLRSLCKEGTPVLALTGTADETTKQAIVSSLSSKEQTDIHVSPNRPDIRMSVFECSKSCMFSQHNWLVQLVRDEGVDTPKTLIFCNTMNDVAAVRNYILLNLGDDAFYPANLKRADSCLIGIYQSNTWDSQKDRIVKAMKGTDQASTKRIVVATTALSMGVNFPDIRYVLNWGPPRSILDYHQEIGRAGRDGKQSDAITYFFGQQLSQCDDDVKDFVKSTTCYRVASLLPFDEQVKSLTPQHNCCSNCKNLCFCNECLGSSTIEFPFQVSADSNIADSSRVARSVSNEDRQDVRDALTELFSMIINTNGGSEAKFYSELVDEIVESCHNIFAISDIVTNYPIFMTRRALKILEISEELFGDTSIPPLEELEIIHDLLNLSPSSVVGLHSDVISFSSDSESNDSDHS